MGRAQNHRRMHVASLVRGENRSIVRVDRYVNVGDRRPTASVDKQAVVGRDFGETTDPVVFYGEADTDE
jgi:hypothetical protein